MPSQEPEPAPKSLGLPPMQMSSLSPATARKVDNLPTSVSSSSIAGFSASNRLQPTKISQLQESSKANLPRISGSASTQSFPSISDRVSNSSSSSRANTPPQPKPLTPTKIPRPFGRSSTLNSPGVGSDDPDAPTVPPAASKPFRRLSSIGNKRLSSSVSSSSFPSESDSFATNSEFGVTREPGLATGERTLSTRRRLESETSSGIPRSRSNAGSALSSSKTFKDLSEINPSIRSENASINTPRRTSFVPTEHGINYTPRTIPSNQNSLGHRRTTSKTLEELKADAALFRRASAAVPTDPLHVALLAKARASRTQTITSTGVIKPITSSRVSSSTANLSSAPIAPDSRRTSGMAEDEIRADEEMSAYVRRQHTKKLAAGMSAEVIQKMFEFPDDTVPLPALGARG